MNNETVDSLLEQADRLYAEGQMKKAMTVYQEVLAQDPQAAWAHSRLGAILAQQGNLEAAEEAFSRALEINPDLAQAHSNLGNIHFSRGEYQEALAKYQEAVKLDPENPVFHQNLHAAHKKLGNLNEAIASLKRSNKLTNKESQAQTRAAFETMKTKAKKGGCLSVITVPLALFVAFIAIAAIW